MEPILIGTALLLVAGGAVVYGEHRVRKARRLELTARQLLAFSIAAITADIMPGCPCDACAERREVRADAESKRDGK